jgi:putative protease
MQELEVLAPAGDLEKLRYALAYGADAVYAGLPQFSLRARDNGFKNLTDVQTGIELCHSLGRKFYLAANILPHNNKIKSFERSLDEICEMRPDALIMTDPGMIQHVLKNHPHVDVHLSVQGNTTNWSTAKFWYELGVKRVILSRELRLREVEDIAAMVPGLEIEVFVHGAVCMAHSGRCMLSNWMSYRDANQGMCTNACRFEYKLYAQNAPQSPDYVPLDGQFFLEESTNPGEMIPIDEDEYGTYIMNAKDLCAIGVLDRLAEVGVCSFKIEGRTKSLYYLSQIVKAYRGATDDVLAGRPISSEHIDAALKTESRGFMAGYFVAPSELPQNYKATRENSQLASVAGLVRSWDPESKKANIEAKGKFSDGELLEVCTPHSNEIIRASSLRDHRGACTTLHSGLQGSIHLEQDPGPYAFLVRPNQQD